MDTCDSHSGSLWLPLALTCSLRLSLALSDSYWISPCLSLAFYGSLWLPLWLSLALTTTLWHTLALSGSLLLSNFAYTALDQLTGPLLGSHRQCHDDALSPALGHCNWKSKLILKTRHSYFSSGLADEGTNSKFDWCCCSRCWSLCWGKYWHQSTASWPVGNCLDRVPLCIPSASGLGNQTSSCLTKPFYKFGKRSEQFGQRLD